MTHTRFARSFAPRVTSLFSILFVAETGSGIAAQAPIRDTPIAADPIPRAAAEAYEPCGDPVSVGWCLQDRIREVERVGAGRFEGDGVECRLAYASERRPDEFACGVLLFGLRPRIEWTDLKAIREAANGEWVRIPETYWRAIPARMRVDPGTERNALVNVIFHPMVMWVEFNHRGGGPVGAEVRPAR